MKEYYAVTVTNVDLEIESTICEGIQEVRTLINNLNDKEYELFKIELLDAHNPIWKDFCKKEPQLETGDKVKTT